MSIARQLLHELRPLFRMLEEPLTMPSQSLFEDPIFKTAFISRPSIGVKEEGKGYVVEADLPGVQKEVIEVRIGDSGRTVTIKGKVSERQRQSLVSDDSVTNAPDRATMATKANDVQPGTGVSNKRPFITDSTFTRTVWLPRPVDTNKVSAKMEAGVLTITVDKMEDKDNVVIPIQ